MNNDIKDLWRIIYEIEGLVLLTENKSENLSHELISLLKEKIVTFQDVIDRIDSCTCRNQLELPIDKQETDSLEEQITNNITQELSLDTDNQETEEILSDEIIVEGHDDSEIINDLEPIEVADDEIEIVELEDEIELEPEIENQETITIEEKLARQNSRDLKHAFTINDRYRFRRELFGNSDTEFIDMINLVSAMTSMSEAEEYFYGDLEWDQENEEVKDFMNIIAHYFAV